jgi:hypothetical protein
MKDGAGETHAVSRLVTFARGERPDRRPAGRIKMKPLHAIRFAGVLSLVGALELGMTTARAQAPAVAPVPQPAAPAVTARAVPGPNPNSIVRRPRVARNAIPKGATVGGRYRDWTANRPIPLAKPWLKAMP